MTSMTCQSPTFTDNQSRSFVLLQVVNSVSEIHKALFDSGVSVKTQYEKCSEDQFTWISEGVHEVYLPKAIDSYTSPLDARNAAYLEISKSATYKASYGNRPVEDVAHNMMFVMPPCSYTGQKVALCADATNNPRLCEHCVNPASSIRFQLAGVQLPANLRFAS